MKDGDFFPDDAAAVVSSERILYTASTFARSSLLHLQEIGSLRALRPHTSSREGLSSYLFFIVTEGSGILSFDGREYALSAGNCVFIDCRRPYSHTPDPDDLWMLTWCHFSGPSMASVYEKYCERGGRPVFCPASSEPVISVLGELMSVAGSNDYLRDMKINSLISRLLVCVMEESWHPEDRKVKQKRSTVPEVKQYLDEHFAERISLDELSQRFFIDKYYLTKSFKQQLGMSILSYLKNVRITRAKQLLRFSNKTVEEIGYETGMESPAYFSRVFKSVEGVSPRQYREEW